MNVIEVHVYKHILCACGNYIVDEHDGTSNDTYSNNLYNLHVKASIMTCIAFVGD